MGEKVGELFARQMHDCAGHIKRSARRLVSRVKNALKTMAVYSARRENEVRVRSVVLAGFESARERKSSVGISLLASLYPGLITPTAYSDQPVA